MGNHKFNSRFASQSCAAFVLLSCASLFSASVAYAQTYSELQNLAFYPVPLDQQGERAVVAAAPAPCCAASVGVVDTGSMQKVAFEGSGFYAPELTRQLTEAGLWHQQQNHHQEAVSHLEKAAASSRIQNGLYSSEQAFLTEHAIQSLLALGRLDEAQDKYEQLLTIARKFYGRESAQTAHALLGLGQLQVERLPLDLPQADGRFDPLYQAQIHFVDAARILIHGEAWSDPALLALENSLIRTYYIDAVRTRAVATPLSYGFDDESSHSRLRSRANRVAAPEQYFKGEQAYLRMADYLQKNPSAGVDEIADVLLGLADWNLLFGNQTEADEHYRRLRDLDAAVSTAMLNPALPVTLPAFVDSPLSPKALPETTSSRGHIDVSFTVDRHGRATHFAVLGTSDGAGATVLSRFETLVRNSRFRPAADADADYTLRYYFSY